jgi:hypothetical protein
MFRAAPDPRSEFSLMRCEVLSLPSGEPVLQFAGLSLRAFEHCHFGLRCNPSTSTEQATVLANEFNAASLFFGCRANTSGRPRPARSPIGDLDRWKMDHVQVMCLAEISGMEGYINLNQGKFILAADWDFGILAFPETDLTRMRELADRIEADCKYMFGQFAGDLDLDLLLRFPIDVNGVLQWPSPK